MRYFLVLLLVMSGATWATAQDFYMPPLLGGDVSVGLAAQSHIQKSEERRAQGGSAPTDVDLTFEADPARTQENLQTFIARTPDAAAKADLETLVATQPGIIAEIGAAIGAYGLSANDVADAYTVWWINSWLVSQMRIEDVAPATVQAVQSQARAALAAAPGIAGTNDAERQLFAEALLLHGTFLDAALRAVQNDPAMLQQLASAASKAARDTGIDLSLMSLTPEGFVAR